MYIFIHTQSLASKQIQDK